MFLNIAGYVLLGIVSLATIAPWFAPIPWEAKILLSFILSPLLLLQLSAIFDR